MSRPTPFLFGRDFHEAEAPPEKTLTLSEHEATLQAAEREAYARGLAAGREEALATETARIADTCTRIVQALAKSVKEADARISARESEAIKLALAFAEKIGGKALEHYPLADIEAAAAACFDEARHAPHAVIRVAPPFVEEVEMRLTAIATERGFAGRLVVIGEPDIAPGDARVEWADGGIVQDRAALLTAITSAVERHIKAPRSGENP